MKALPKPVSKPCYVEYIHYEHANLTPYTLVGEIVPKEAGKPIYRYWYLLEGCRTHDEAVAEAKKFAPLMRQRYFPSDVNAMPQEILY